MKDVLTSIWNIVQELLISIWDGIKELFNSILNIISMPIAILMIIATACWQQFFPESFQKWQEDFDNRCRLGNNIYKYVDDHTPGLCMHAKPGSVGERMWQLMQGFGCEFAADSHFNDPPEWSKTFWKIMKKYNLDYQVNPPAEIYAALRFEVDPEYRSIVEKVKAGELLTEAEQALYDEIHYEPSK